MEVINQQKIKEMAEEIILALREGEYVVVRDSLLNPFYDVCDGWHTANHIAKLKGKLMLIDYVKSDLGKKFYEVLREITKEEAVEMLAEHLTEYIEYLVEENSYTKEEIEKHIKDSNPTGKIKVCEKHNEVYFEDERCPDCEGRV